MVEDADKVCVKKPCKGDPIPNPEIAPQKGKSGALGALHGCTRYGGRCSGADARNKSHDGIDIKNDYGKPIFAMFDGEIHSNYYQENGAGYVTRIKGVAANGDILIYQYFHLQQSGRKSRGTKVRAGEIVGIQGDSGNLKNAINSGGVDSHVHIKMNTYDGSGNEDDYSSNYKSNKADPSLYFTSKIDENGNVQLSNCN
jgi:murein DD-endopeptidase MepM/ murein hydrolase activator NlpD